LKAETLSPEQREELVAELKVQSEEMQNKFATIVFRTMSSLQKQEKMEEPGVEGSIQNIVQAPLHPV
jgi:ribosome-associated toxin RatA of RatAB toxin-antitoxin module